VHPQGLATSPKLYAGLALLTPESMLE
jgi:hypothetical protein